MKIRFKIPKGPRFAPALTFALGLMALMAACAAAPGGSEEPSAEITEAVAAPEADLVSMLPADITTIGFVDFAAVRGTAFYDYLRSDASAINPAEFEEMVERTGINPMTDLHRIAYVSSQGFGSMDDAGSLIVQATFDRTRIEETMAAMPTEEYSGRTLFHAGSIETRNNDEESGDSEIEIDVDAWFTILSDSVLAFGDSEKLRAVVDVADGAPNARSNDELMGLLEDVDPAAQMWVISAQEGLFQGITPGEGSPVSQIGYDRINALIMSIDLTDGISLRMRGRTPIEDDAKNIGDALNGMLALGKMMLQSSSPEVFEILDNDVKAGSSGRDVTIKAQLSMEDILTLQNFARDTLSEGQDEGDVGN